MQPGWLAIALALVSACLPAGSTQCADGTVCPSQTVCDPSTAGACIDPDQVAACAGLADEAACRYRGVDDGACFDGVCRPAGCGNGHVEAGRAEVCDDGNTADNDGCSNDCSSDERCGNGLVDSEQNEQCDDGGALSHDGCSSACVVEVANWLPLPDAMTARYAPTVIGDLARGVAVVIGGGDVATGSALDETWETDGATWQRTDPARAPLARFAAAAVFDPRRGRVLLFGGEVSASALDDLWEWTGETWRELRPARRPSARIGHAMVYDEARGEVLLYGGADSGGTTLTDLWRYDGRNWDLVPVTSPAIQAPLLVFDAERAVTLALDSSSGATWTFDGAVWTAVGNLPGQANDVTGLGWDPATRVVLATGIGSAYAWSGSWAVVPAPPTPVHCTPVLVDGVIHALATAQGPRAWRRDGSAWVAVPAPERAPRMLAITADNKLGQLVAVDYNGRTWLWTGLGWRGTSSTSSPGQAEALAADAAGRVLRVSVRAGGSLVLVLEWTGADWTPLATTGGPTAAERVALAHDDDGFILAANTSIAGMPFSSWRLDGTTWTALDPGQDESDTQLELAFDPRRDRLVAYSRPLLGRVLSEFDGTTWNTRSTDAGPGRRFGHGMAYDPHRGRVVVYAGDTPSGTAVNDMWEWDGDRWRVATARSSSASAVVMAYDGRRGQLVAVTRAVDGEGFPATTALLRYRSELPHEACTGEPGPDLDDDGLRGCADPDCWATCRPACPPGATGPACP